MPETEEVETTEPSPQREGLRQRVLYTQLLHPVSRPAMPAGAPVTSIRVWAQALGEAPGGRVGTSAGTASLWEHWLILPWVPSTQKASCGVGAGEHVRICLRNSASPPPAPRFPTRETGSRPWAHRREESPRLGTQVPEGGSRRPEPPFGERPVRGQGLV